MLDDILEQLRKAKQDLGGDLLFYRGHSDSNWLLFPGLARRKASGNNEEIIYYDFITRAGALLAPNSSLDTNIRYAAPWRGAKGDILYSPRQEKMIFRKYPVK